MTKDDRVEQLSLLILGVEGQGGLLREVNQMDARITECEKRLNTASGKWLVLMILLASLGQLGADFLIRLLLR